MKKLNLKSPHVRRGLRVFGTCFFIYLLFCVFIYLIQIDLIYHPKKLTLEEQLSLASQYNAQEWKDSSGEFAGWMVGSEKAPKTVVVFHGNMDVAVVRKYLADPFLENPLSKSWRILLFEYPGFGHRPGSPNEKLIVEQALRAVDSLSGPLILVGESLGSGVASHVASQRPHRVEGVLLITPYNNMKTAASFHYPLLPIGMILKEQFPSDSLLRNYPGKVALMIAEKDEIIPAWIGNRLYDSIQSPKKKWIIPNALHNGISHKPEMVWWQEAIAFLAQKP